ncbi:MAG: hypothetical protein H6943_10125 [Zoogloeaceae bacterium]|nr:hypothetical protein [Zoogloeaceae bacterium]
MLALCLPSSADAEVPIAGRDNPLLGAEGTYRLEYQQSTWSLHIQAAQAKKPVAIDLSACFFCKREIEEGEDGEAIGDCEGDGVFPIVIKKVAYVGVACHIGVHSHRVQLFPASQSAPAFSVTGDYFTELAVLQDGVVVDYDRRTSHNIMKQKQSRFPSNFVPNSSSTNDRSSQQSAQLKPALTDLRAGPVDDAPILARMKPQTVFLHGAPITSGWQFVSRKDGIFGYVKSNELQF